MATFLRVYLGGESALKPWVTGEAGHPQSACPMTRRSELSACADVVKQSTLLPPPSGRKIARPDSSVKPTTATPVAPDYAGGEHEGEGFTTSSGATRTRSPVRTSPIPRPRRPRPAIVTAPPEPGPGRREPCSTGVRTAAGIAGTGRDATAELRGAARNATSSARRRSAPA